jgi:hypothetical protein
MSSNGRQIAYFYRGICLLVACADAIHPVLHMIHSRGFPFQCNAIGTVELLGIIVDAAGIFSGHHIGCAADVLNRAVSSEKVFAQSVAALSVNRRLGSVNILKIKDLAPASWW